MYGCLSVFKCVDVGLFLREENSRFPDIYREHLENQKSEEKKQINKSV